MMRSQVSLANSSLAMFLTTSNSFWVTRRSSSPKGCFAKIVRKYGSFSRGHLRRINAHVLQQGRRRLP